MKDIRQLVQHAFPIRGDDNDAIPIAALFDLFFAEALSREITSWTEITRDDMERGSFGGLLQFLSDESFVSWLPAWLVFVPKYGVELPRALVGFGALSPRICKNAAMLDRLEARVGWLQRDQRRVVAEAGRAIAGDADIIKFGGFDLGRDIADAWDRYSESGFSA